MVDTQVSGSAHSHRPPADSVDLAPPRAVKGHSEAFYRRMQYAVAFLTLAAAAGVVYGALRWTRGKPEAKQLGKILTGVGAGVMVTGGVVGKVAIPRIASKDPMVQAERIRGAALVEVYA